MLACTECAWNRVLQETNHACDDLDGIAYEGYQSCNYACHNRCDPEATDVWNCVKAFLYCDEPLSESEKHKKMIIYQDEDDDAECFSLDSTVVVKGKGTTPIKDLVIGDMVLSNENGSYTRFFSIGHYNKNHPTKFLQVYTESSKKRPLEVTPDHLIYKGGGFLPVLASSVNVGDSIQTLQGPSKVTFIKEISRKGFINAHTVSGTMVVDGVVTSNYVVRKGHEGVESEADGWLHILNYKVVHMHHLMRIIYAPHRIVCGHLMTCTQDRTQDELIPVFHRHLNEYYLAVKKMQSMLLSISFLLNIVSFGTIFFVFELLLNNVFVFAAIVGVGFVMKRLNKSIKIKEA